MTGTAKTLTGILTGMFENERSDAITLDRTTKVILSKGDGKKVLHFKGKNVIVEAAEKEFNGKILYMANANNIKLDESKPNPSAETTSSTAYSGKGYQPKYGGNMDQGRQNSIIFQSMAKVAAEVCTYNASTAGRPVLLQDIVDWANDLARHALKPTFGEDETPQKL